MNQPSDQQPQFVRYRMVASPVAKSDVERILRATQEVLRSVKDVDSDERAQLIDLKSEYRVAGWKTLREAIVNWAPKYPEPFPGPFPGGGLEVRAGDTLGLHSSTGIATIAKPNF